MRRDLVGNIVQRPRHVPAHTAKGLPARAPVGTRLAAVLGAICIALGAVRCAQCAAAQAAGAQTGDGAPTTLEDPPQPFHPRRPRSGADQDRVEALALFAAARTLERRSDDAQALRLYQRAVRCDPEAAAPYAAVVRMAARLGRYDEAVRYALIAPPGLDVDPLMLRRLGVYLTRLGRLEDAVVMYEQTVAAKGPDSDAADILLRMEMGRLYHLVGRFREAAGVFEIVLHALDHPDQYGIDDQVRKTLLDEPASTWRLIGECFLRAGKAQAAHDAFIEADRAEPNPTTLQYDLARVHAQQGKYKEAFEALSTVLDQGLSGEGVEPFELLAEVLEHLGRREDLLPQLEDLRAEHPEDVRLGLYLAGRYFAAGKKEQAEALYHELLEQSPERLPTGEPQLVEQAWRNLVSLRRAGPPEALLATLGRIVRQEGSLEVLGPVLEQLTADAEGLRALHRAALARKRDASAPIEDQTIPAAALLALEAERFEAAAELLEYVIEQQPSEAPALVRLWGTRLLAADRPAEAAEVFRGAIDRQPDEDREPLLHYYLAIALALDHKTDEALQAAQTAARLAPDSARFQGRVAWVLYLGDRHDEARRAYEELIRRFDEQYDSPLVREELRDARLALSNLCVTSDQLPAAEEHLERVLDEFPEDVSASNDLGYLWADQGKHLHRALRMIRRAVAAEPDNPAYRDSLGWVYYRLGCHQAALAELERAAADQPDPVILDHLGDVQRKLGRLEEARRAWQRALEGFRQQQQSREADAVEQKLDRLDAQPAQP